MTDKIRFTKVTTPKGVAKFPSITAPDTKFNADGEYQCRVILDPSPERDKLVATLEKENEAAYQKAKAELTEAFQAATGEKKAKAKKALEALTKADGPVKPVYDEDGEETDRLEFGFKMKAQRKDQKTGAVIKQKPALFQADGSAFPPGKDVWGGSIVRVSGTVTQYYVPGTNLAGASLRLAAVQIITLRTKGSGDAGAYGFGAEDGDAFEDENGFRDESGDGYSGSSGDDADSSEF